MSAFAYPRHEIQNKTFAGGGGCVDSQGCLEDRACVSGACVDPCAGACKQNHFCKVKAHNPICSQSASSQSEWKVVYLENKYLKELTS